MANNGRTNGSNVQHAANGCACQQWTVTHLDNGHYTLAQITERLSKAEPDTIDTSVGFYLSVQKN